MSRVLLNHFGSRREKMCILKVCPHLSWNETKTCHFSHSQCWVFSLNQLRSQRLHDYLENMWLLHVLCTQTFQGPVMKDQALKMLWDSDVNSKWCYITWCLIMERKSNCTDDFHSKHFGDGRQLHSNDLTVWCKSFIIHWKKVLYFYFTSSWSLVLRFIHSCS